jgi:hypothetical protein
MRLTGLVDHLRSWGFDVVEVAGWKTRGVDFPAKPQVVVCHHTGTPPSTTKDYPSLVTVRDGREDLSGPLSQLGLGYSGTVYVIAAGVAHHAGKGSWRGINVGNERSVGIEAESPGDGTWTPKQREVYPRLAACVADYLEQPATNICAHRESALPAGRKPDPVGIDMPKLRAAADGWIKRGGKPPTPKPAPTPTNPEDDDMIGKIYTCTGRSTRYFTAGGVTKVDAAEVKILRARGVPVEAISSQADFGVLVAIHERLMPAPAAAAASAPQ